MIDFEPTDDQKLISETVRQFAANEIRPAARAAAESARLPQDLLARAHELGLVASALDGAWGGGGERSAITGVLVAEELAWGDLALALAILSPSLLAYPLQDFGSEEQKRAQLPLFTAQKFAPGSLAIVEPRFDADALRPHTRARRVGADYVIEGRKCFVPWLDGGDAVLVVADEDGSPQVYLVPRDAPGLKAEPERNMGLEALPTVELELTGVRVPASARLGEGAGSDVGAIVRRGRVGLAAAAVGLARAAFEIARDYAKERETFGAPIATRQAIAFKLADMAIEIDAARLLVWEAAWILDGGGDARRAVALAWDQATRIALDVADGAVQVLGGHGYTREYLPELHLRNARGLALFEALTLV